MVPGRDAHATPGRQRGRRAHALRRRRGAAPASSHSDRAPARPSAPECGPWRRDTPTGGPPHRRSRGRRCSGVLDVGRGSRRHVRSRGLGGERAAVHLGQVDSPLHPVGERVERAHRVMPAHPEFEGEVVARPCRDADERQVVRGLRSQARAANPARPAAPSPDLGLTNRTGRRGGSQELHPYRFALRPDRLLFRGAPLGVCSPGHLLPYDSVPRR